MTPHQVTDVKPYDLITENDLESSDEIDSDEDEIRLDMEAEKAELEAIQALEETKVRITELNRKSLVRLEEWKNWRDGCPGLCDNIALLKEDPLWASLSAMVVAEYHGTLLLPSELEMIVLSRFANRPDEVTK
jgi:hypothetical protein